MLNLQQKTMDLLYHAIVLHGIMGPCLGFGRNLLLCDVARGSFVLSWHQKNIAPVYEGIFYAYVYEFPN